MPKQKIEVSVRQAPRKRKKQNLWKTLETHFLNIPIKFQRLIAIILIVASLGTAAGGFTLDKLNLIQFSDGKSVGTEPINPEDDAGLVTEEELASLDYVESYPGLPNGEIYKDKNVVNILLLGTDERTRYFNDNARSDTMMVVSVNKQANTIKLVSIERATGVPILEGQYKGQYDWLTHCFRYGGESLIIKEIQSCFLLDLQGYIRTNIYSFIKLIDAVGGVDVELSPAEVDYINNWYNYEYARYHVDEMGIRTKLQWVNVGWNHLMGPTAMLYARCRQIDNDFGRMSRQRIVIESAFSQIKNLSIPELNNLLNTMLPLVQSNLTKSQMAGLMLEVPSFKNASFDTMVLPEKGTYGRMTGMEGRSLFAPDFEKNVADLKEFLYSY